MNQLNPETVGNTPEFTNLKDYEVFVRQDWLYGNGTDEAQLHVRGKLEEEAREAAEAIKSEDPLRIIDELGDFLWTADASALNVGITFEESLRHELRPDKIGEGSIDVSLIDQLALELIPEESANEMAGWVNYLGHYLGKASKQWHNLSPLVDQASDPQNFSDAWILLKRDRTFDGLTQALLVTSAIAQRHAGKSLADIMQHNADKLQARQLSGSAVTTLPK
ncbi:MAG TPA: MazG nucleotide pyrophosphohydrolase domain-containing protein [Candidatus Saccharimonadales bacterium]